MNPLNPSGKPAVVTPVQGFDAFVLDEPWPWRDENADAIAEHWEHAVAEKPSLFDGEVLVARRFSVEGGIWRGAHIVIRYSALKYWLSRGFIETGACNTFASAVVVTADGAVLLGRMGDHTANAGRLYFPCGTPDMEDVQDGRLDFEASMLRELEEETGLRLEDLQPTEQRWISLDGPLVCCARRIDTGLTAAEVLARFEAHRAAGGDEELAGLVLVRSADEVDNVLEYARALVEVVTTGRAI
jgi:8-oxo-dGTP pyrophosphatase MutT (NUDIX family)